MEGDKILWTWWGADMFQAARLKVTLVGNLSKETSARTSSENVTSRFF